MTFGDKLKIIRASRSLSQQQMADLLCTTKQAISRYENSEREPNIRTAREFSEKLGIDLTFLADDELYFPIRERIAELMADRGLSSSQFSTLVGIMPARLDQIMSGEVIPSQIEIARISEQFSVSVDYILGLEWRTESGYIKLHPAELDIILAYRRASPNYPSPADVDLLISALAQLNEEGREKLLDYAADLVSTGKYKKHDSDQLGKKA